VYHTLGKSLEIRLTDENEDLPAGRWTNFWTNKVVQGSRWIKETHAFDTLPLYVREGSILVLGNEGEKRTVYDWSQTSNHEIRLYEPNASSHFSLYDENGQHVTALSALEVHGVWKVDGMDGRVRRLSKDQNY